MNLEEIKELIRVFGRSKLEKLKIKDGEFEIDMSKESTPSAAVTVAQNVAAMPAQSSVPVDAAPAQVTAVENKTDSSKEGEIIKSPMVGTFYAAPSPDSAPFVKVGDTVNKGQVLCILEAMKIMNELEAEFSCKILEVLVEDGQPVEFDMPLFRVERI